MEEQREATNEQASARPAPNTKAYRARLYRERRKHELNEEQVEENRRKNRDRQKRFRDRRKEQKEQDKKQATGGDASDPPQPTGNISSHFALAATQSPPTICRQSRALNNVIVSGLAGADPSLLAAVAACSGAVTSLTQPPASTGIGIHGDAMRTASAPLQSLPLLADAQPASSFAQAHSSEQQQAQQQTDVESLQHFSEAGDEPFREIQISNRADAAAGALQDGSAATASDGSAAAALEQEASRLADHCLQSFSNLPADSRVLLLKGCLSRLREQLGEEALDCRRSVHPDLDIPRDLYLRFAASPYVPAW